MKLKAAIVDDEPMARIRLRRLLRSVANEDIEVVLEAVDVDDLLYFARKTRIDVLFLDIEMPGQNGMSVIERWEGVKPMTVFVTAYDEFAARAFDLRAIDYLTKPVSVARLKDTVRRLLAATKQSDGRAETRADGRLVPLAIGSRIDLVAESDIQIVEAQGNYLDITCRHGRYSMRNTLASFHGGLTEGMFIRIHKSAIVQRSAIREIRSLGSGRYRLKLSSGEELTTGRTYQDVIRDLRNGVRAMRDQDDA
jgi:two-component system, LytTR family, response regulator